MENIISNTLLPSLQTSSNIELPATTSVSLSSNVDIYRYRNTAASCLLTSQYGALSHVASTVQASPNIIDFRTVTRPRQCLLPLPQFASYSSIPSSQTSVGAGTNIPCLSNPIFGNNPERIARLTRRMEIGNLPQSVSTSSAITFATSRSSASSSTTPFYTSTTTPVASLSSSSISSNVNALQPTQPILRQSEFNANALDSNIPTSVSSPNENAQHYLSRNHNSSLLRAAILRSPSEVQSSSRSSCPLLSGATSVANNIESTATTHNMPTCSQSTTQNERETNSRSSAVSLNSYSSVATMTYDTATLVEPTKGFPWPVSIVGQRFDPYKKINYAHVKWDNALVPMTMITSEKNSYFPVEEWNQDTTKTLEEIYEEGDEYDLSHPISYHCAYCSMGFRSGTKTHTARRHMHGSNSRRKTSCYVLKCIIAKNNHRIDNLKQLAPIPAAEFLENEFVQPTLKDLLQRNEKKKKKFEKKIRNGANNLT